MNKNLDGENKLDEENKKDVSYEKDEMEFGVVEILRFLLSYKKFIFLFTSIFTLLAMGYSLLLQPIYTSQVTMMEVSEDLSSSSGLSGGFASTFSNLPLGLSFGSSEGSKALQTLAILQSRTFIEDFIKEKNLLIILFDEEWDQSKNAWKDEPFDLHDGYIAFKGFFNISKDIKTELYTLTIEWKDPGQAADWANSLIEKINLSMRLKSINEAERNILFLEQELEKNTLMNPQNMLYNLIEEQTKSKMLANVQEQHVFVIIDKAIPAKERSKPERRKITIFGFLIGFILSIVFVYLTNYIQVLKTELSD